MRAVRRLLGACGVALALAAHAAPRTPPELPQVDDAAWAAGKDGVRRVTLADGAGSAVRTGDVARVEITAWTASGEVAFTTYGTDAGMELSPGRGTLHPAIEASVIGARAGARLLVATPLAPDGPPMRVLVEVVDVRQARRPPDAPPSVDAGAWTTSRSGLKSADVAVGEGKAAGVGDILVVEYTGWLADGTRFDSSLARPQPFRFTIGAGQVIRGWEEGAVGMKPGGVRLLEIPPDLGYGKRGQPPTIPAQATLTFEIRLISVR